MKILLVHNTYQQPGGEDVVFEQERRLLQQMGHTVATYCRGNHEIEELSTIGRATLLTRTVWAADTHRDFGALLVRENPEIVHVHNTFVMISPSIYSACREHNIPVVQTLHNFRLLCPAAQFLRDGKICEDCVDHSLWRSVWHGCYRDSRPATASVALMLAWHRQSGTWYELIDRYIALTGFARNKFIASGFPADKIVVKPNFVAPDPGAKQIRGEYAVFVGRISKEKGWQTLLDSWRQLPKDCPLQIIGDGPQRQELEQEVHRRGFSSIQFRGRLSHAETLAAIKGSYLLVMPSQWYEGFPMTIAESFACGTPVICSRLGAMEEIVDDFRTGLHFAPGNSEDLAQKLAWAFAHPSEMAAMGRAARGEYEAHYAPQRAYRQLMDIYEQTLAAYACVQPA